MMKFEKVANLDELSSEVEGPAGAMLDIDDETLANVSGGCCPPYETTANCSPCPPRVCN